MKQRFTIILAGLTLACFAGFAGCDDDETGTGTGTGTGAGTGAGTGTGTGTPTGGDESCADMYEADSCELACCQLWTCVMEEPDQCPGLQDTELDEFIDGVDSDGCAAGCEANPALKSLIDPEDCATTVATILSVNSDFEESCADGGGGGAGGMAGGGGAPGGMGGAGGATGGMAGAGGQ